MVVSCQTLRLTLQVALWVVGSWEVWLSTEPGVSGALMPGCARIPSPIPLLSQSSWILVGFLLMESSGEERPQIPPIHRAPTSHC